MTGMGAQPSDLAGAERPQLRSLPGADTCPRIQTWEWLLLISGFPKDGVSRRLRRRISVAQPLHV